MFVPSVGSSSINLSDPPQSSSSQGRKRQRSQSMESDSAVSTSSVKRSTADNSSNDQRARGSLPGQSAILSLSSDPNQDIDAYMAQSGALYIPPVVSPPLYQETAMQPVSLEEKHQIVKKGKERKMEVRETWYLVSRGWYKRWEKACTGEVDKEGPVMEKDLGPVDNSGLLDIYGNLLPSLVEGVDLEYVPAEVWTLFVQWYGPPPHPLPRSVIVRGHLKDMVIELRPLRLKVFRLVKSSSEGANSSHGWITISAGETVTALCAALSKAVALTTQELPYRIWRIGIALDDSQDINYPASQLPMSDAKILDAIDKTLEEEGIELDDAFAVEFKQSHGWIAEAPRSLLQPAPVFSSEDGFFNKMSTTLSPVSSVTAYKGNYFNAAGTSVSKPSVPLTVSSDKPYTKALEPGTLGLGNMGNTCFMNSALQCLGHTKELADYFIGGIYENEINRDNPLGMGGAIAESFGALLNRMWASSGASTSYSPREFKMQLQRFAPQFSGYQQHDSQELVAFLLDGLHEDLNRVLKKPYVEKPDWEGGDVLELVRLAQKSWEGYMKRNDSIIVDLFQGQYQSTLVCPECEKVSITFDPFMYLTLPLPVQKKWRHTIFYIPWDVQRPHMKVPIEINRDASFKDLRILLGRWLDAVPENLLTLEIFNSRFYKNLDDTVAVADMSDNDVIVCFELPCNARQSRSYKKKPDDPAIIPVYFCDIKATRSTYFRTTSLFGYPIVVVIDEEQARSLEAMYEAVIVRLERWTEMARDLYVWEVGQSSETQSAHLVEINGYAPMESLTEIREDGKVVTIESGASLDGDIADEKGMLVDGEGEIRCVGVKEGLFDLRLQVNHKDYGTSFSGYSFAGQWVSWEDRLHEVDTHPNLLRDNDAFFCEFDEDKKIYYFGDGPRPEHARWDHWEVFTHPELEEAKKAAAEKSHKGITLQDCLEEFTKQEKLGEDDLWYCPQCKKHQQATKQFDLWKAPDVLVVHLKRFSNNRIFRDKIDTHIDFPIEGLDLTDMVKERAAAKQLLERGVDLETLGLDNLDEPLIYDLYAVDEHLGGLGGGHYRAYATNHMNGKWYHFDDSYVMPAQASDSINPNAYLLFYRRRTNSPLGYKPLQDSLLSQEFQGGEFHSIETQLPTPPNETAPMNHKMELSALQDGDTWNLRSMGTSSISSPPADDPDYDESPYPPNLLRQHCDYSETALKASPTSSNAADGDLETDIEDAAWDPTSVADLSPDASLSDMGRFSWDDPKEEDDAIIIQHADDDMSTKEAP